MLQWLDEEMEDCFALVLINSVDLEVRIFMLNDISIIDSLLLDCYFYCNLPFWLGLSKQSNFCSSVFKSHFVLVNYCISIFSQVSLIFRVQCC